MMRMRKLQNPNPTVCELLLWGCGCYYRVEHTIRKEVYRKICSAKPDSEYPGTLSVSELELSEDFIRFDLEREAVLFSDGFWVDPVLAGLIVGRMQELGWRQA